MALEQHATTQNMFLKFAHTNVFHATRTTLLPRARFVFTGQHMIHMYDGGRTSISCGPHKHMLSEDREVTSRRWVLAKIDQKAAWDNIPPTEQSSEPSSCVQAAHSVSVLSDSHQRYHRWYEGASFARSDGLDAVGRLQ